MAKKQKIGSNRKKRQRSSLLYVGIIAIALLIISTVSYQTYSIFNTDTVAFTYTHADGGMPLSIGIKQFSPQSLTYTCEYMGEVEVRYPEPSPDCWESRAVFAGREYAFTAGVPVEIHPLVTVTMRPDAKVTFLEGYVREPIINEDWKTVYTFEIETDDLLTSSIRKVKPQALLGSDQVAIIIITNRLTSFTADNAGYWIRTTHKLLERGESWDRYNASMYEGENAYLIPVDTTELGDVELEVQPFIEIEADKTIRIIQDRPITLSYEVVQEIPNQPGANGIEKGTDGNENESSAENFAKIKQWWNAIIMFLFRWLI